ncbi:hypothetical protein MOQ_009507 [Trypanosoma cruzi marinkellei]|uniref:Flagellar attachment zone protein 1 conserved domain-containing protein n=1 Tax=Trypanosoma cruzi marinkellei TaxID=85056 RepID=K2NCK6_TRYCR|nr:hypothetical protein MOQ_009507 [Trypanosoma cruzi marinkellei]
MIFVCPSCGSAIKSTLCHDCETQPFIRHGELWKSRSKLNSGLPQSYQQQEQQRVMPIVVMPPQTPRDSSYARPYDVVEGLAVLPRDMDDDKDFYLPPLLSNMFPTMQRHPAHNPNEKLSGRNGESPAVQEKPLTLIKLPQTRETLPAVNMETTKEGNNGNIRTIHRIQFEGDDWDDILPYSKNELYMALQLDIYNSLPFPSSFSIKITSEKGGFFAYVTITRPAEVGDDVVCRRLSEYHFPETRRLYQSAQRQLSAHVLTQNSSEYIPCPNKPPIFTLPEGSMHDQWGGKAIRINGETYVCLGNPQSFDKNTIATLKMNSSYLFDSPPSQNDEHIIDNKIIKRSTEVEDEELAGLASTSQKTSSVSEKTVKSRQSDLAQFIPVEKHYYPTTNNPSAGKKINNDSLLMYPEMRGGRSLESLPQIITVVPHGERPMSGKSFDVSSVHENEMEGGRSLESLPQSVTVVPRGERPMSGKSFDVSSVHENEMDDWCLPARGQKYRSVLDKDIFLRMLEMDGWCLPPRRLLCLGERDSCHICSSDEVVVSGNGLSSLSKPSVMSCCDSVAPSAVASAQSEVVESSMTKERNVFFVGEEDAPCPVFHGIRCEAAVSPLFSGACNPEERWLDVLPVGSIDKNPWKLSQDTARSRSIVSSQKILPVTEAVGLLKGSSNVLLEESEEALMLSVGGTDGHLLSDDDMSLRNSEITETKEVALAQRGNELVGALKDECATVEGNKLVKRTLPTGAENREVVPLKKNVLPWDTQESSFALEVYELSASNFSDSSRVEIWLEGENTMAFSRLLQHLEDAERVIRKPVELLRRLMDNEGGGYCYQA